LFTSVNITQLKTPDKIENHVNEKFRREKNEITKAAVILDEELSNIFYFYKIGREMYLNKDKLRDNIFKDFEKQESWQSYTTLLFAELNTNMQKKKNT
jgi:hypothetical protein